MLVTREKYWWYSVCIYGIQLSGCYYVLLQNCKELEELGTRETLVFLQCLTM